MQQEKQLLEGQVAGLQSSDEGQQQDQVFDSSISTNDPVQENNADGAPSASPTTSLSTSTACAALEESTAEEEFAEHVTVTAQELEAVQRLLLDKDAQITRLQSMLEERDQEMDQMFEGQMLVSREMIQSHLQEAEQQRQRVESLQEQLESQGQEMTRLRAKVELRKSSGAGQGEESAFQEQLIMDKMVLEEAVQEKESELQEARERNEELQAQLADKRQQLNALRQEHEDMMETLLEAQQQLITLQRTQEYSTSQLKGNVCQCA